MRKFKPMDIPYYRNMDVANLPNEPIELVFSNGDTKRMYFADACLHRILWKPYEILGVPITKQDVYKVFPPTKALLSKIHTMQYARILDLLPETNYLTVVKLLHDVIGDTLRFVISQCGNYTQTMDILDIIDTMNSPELKELACKPIDTSMGIRYVEEELRARGRRLNKLLSTPGAVKNNKLIAHTATEVLKEDQLPQLLIAFGLRSDIDDRVMKHVILRSALNGMQTPEDFAVESLSSKKSTRFNQTIIRGAQTIHKNLKLYASNVTVKYPGDCTGSKFTVPHIIHKGYERNYLDKVVFFEGMKIAITDDNYRDFGGRRVELISALQCQYEDGVCEVCAGRNTPYPWKYVPDVDLGPYAVSVVCSIASQKVLSTKHLVIVVFLSILLGKKALEFLKLEALDDEDGERYQIRLAPETAETSRGKYLVINSISHLHDLRNPALTPQMFGTIQKVGIADDEASTRRLFDIGEDSTKQHFTPEFLEYMRSVMPDILCPSKVNSIECGPKYFIPLNRWDINKPIFDVLLTNSDMARFIDQLRHMFGKNMSLHTTTASVLQSMTDFMYSKISVNVFYIEIMLKAIMSYVAHPNGKMEIKPITTGIADKSIAGKLGHGEIMKFLRSPESGLGDRASTKYDGLFGRP